MREAILQVHRFYNSGRHDVSGAPWTACEGNADFVNGLLPDKSIKEDKFNLGIIGDINEPILSETLSRITGTSKKVKNLNPYESEILFNPINSKKQIMYAEGFKRK